MPGIVLDARIIVDNFPEDNYKSTKIQCSVISVGQGTCMLRRQTAGAPGLASLVKQAFLKAGSFKLKSEVGEVIEEVNLVAGGLPRASSLTLNVLD